MIPPWLIRPPMLAAVLLACIDRRTLRCERSDHFYGPSKTYNRHATYQIEDYLHSGFVRHGSTARVQSVWIA
jgi:hypothetical protein